jgi:hypothetical protein
MPVKKARHKIIHVGYMNLYEDNATGSEKFFGETDTSAFDYAIIMVKVDNQFALNPPIPVGSSQATEELPGATAGLNVYSCPDPLGTPAVSWYKTGASCAPVNNENWAWTIPAYTYSQQFIPRRIRFGMYGTVNYWGVNDNDELISPGMEVWLNLVRDVG